MQRKIIKITFADGSSTYLQGFDVSGQAITGVKGHAHAYPDWMAPTAAKNALRTCMKATGTDTEDSEVIADCPVDYRRCRR